MTTTRLARFAWGVLAYNLLVILWGAFVRATGSGAGCGSHWPLCNGEIVPRAARIETLIEFSHRLSSGLALILTIVLVVWAFRLYPLRHRVRRGALASLIFLLIEALIGAGLVLFEYVASNVSLARAYWMAGHLTNTFFLLAVLTLTAWWTSGGQPLRLSRQGSTVWALGAALFAFLLLGAGGGITALGDTLVLTAGISPEESPIVAGLVGLRIYHPLWAIVVFAIISLVIWQLRTWRPDAQVRRFSNLVLALYVLQLLVGAVNVVLKAPVLMQLTHLLLADSIWIALVLLTASALAVDPLAAEASEASTAANQQWHPARR